MRGVHLIALVLAALRLGVGPADAQPRNPPDIVARINGTSITRAQFDARLAQSRSMNPERYDAMTPVERDQAMLRTLNSMVVREIEVQEAERRGLVVGDDEIEGDLRGLTEMARTRGGVDGLLTEYRITLDQWKEEARRTLLIQKLEDAEAARLPVAADEVREEFTRNFWEGQGSPPDAVLAEHRDHMQGVIRQRKWAVHRREWLRPLVDGASVWRWTPTP